LKKLPLPTDDEMDIPIGVFLSNHYNTRSLKRRDIKVSSPKLALTDTNSGQKKKQNLNRKRKAMDSHGQWPDVHNKAFGSDTTNVEKRKKIQHREVDVDLINKQEDADTKNPSYPKGNESARQIQTSNKVFNKVVCTV
jgi:hypothetical protein